MVKNIVSKVAKKNETINLEKFVDKHLSAIKEYGNKEGWPLHVGVVYDEDKDFALADVEYRDKEIVICSTIINRDVNKKKMVAALSSEINFLV